MRCERRGSHQPEYPPASLRDATRPPREAHGDKTLLSGSWIAMHQQRPPQPVRRDMVMVADLNEGTIWSVATYCPRRSLLVMNAANDRRKSGMKTR
jgi:hypothetical protein